MRLTASLLLVLAAGAARAADAPAADADSISAAKKDLASIKAGAGQPDLSLSFPAIDAKDLGPVPGSVPLAAPALADRDPTADPAKKKPETGNWLVDAMEAGERRRPGEAGPGAGQPRSEADLLRGDDRTGPRSERDPQAQDESRDSGGSKESLGPVYNPLDAFMSGWVSDRDRSLLLGPKGEVLAGGDSGGAGAESLPGLEAPAAPSAEDLLGMPEVSAIPESGGGPNPYLEGLGAAGSETRAFTLTEGTQPEAFPAQGFQAPAVEPAAGRVEDASRTFVPDFAQPSDDDKYFKQLKRF